MASESSEPRIWSLTALDQVVVLAQWLQIELVLGAHAVELRGTLTPEARWTWIPQGVPVPTKLEHADWKRTMAEGDTTRCECEAHALATEIVAVAKRALGDQEATVRSHGALVRPGETVFLIRDARRAEALRSALRGIGELSTAHADDGRAKTLALVLMILRADELRLSQLADRLTSEEVAALRALASNG